MGTGVGAERRTNNKVNPHMVSMQGIKPRPHNDIFTYVILVIVFQYQDEMSLFCTN